MVRLSNVDCTPAFAVVAFLLLLLMALPHNVYAQQNAGDLSSTIKAALLSDPRTSAVPQEEIDAIVGVLTQEAQREGVAVGDIGWRPQSAGEEFVAGDVGPAVADTCGRSLLCRFNEAFGFVGPDPTIPFILGVASMGLVWIIAEMLHRRSRKVASQQTPPSA